MREKISAFMRNYFPPPLPTADDVIFGADQDTDHLLEQLRQQRDREFDPIEALAHLPCG